MTRKRWARSVLLCLFFSSCSSMKIQETSQSPFQIPVHFLSCSDSPMVKVNIEGSEYVLMLDLGANVHLILKDRVLQKLHYKERIETLQAIDIQGNRYNQPKFKIDSCRLGHLEIKNPIATEENLFFIREGSRIITGRNDRRINQRIEQVDGKIGSEFFCSSGCTCFLDMSRSLLCVGKTLKDITEMHLLTGFLKTTLEVDNGLICVHITTDHGVKRFVLDTGAERSVLKKSPSDPKEIKLTLKNLGSWNFYTLNFPEGLPPVDGILGIDFLKKHAVCLDFLDHAIYIK